MPRAALASLLLSALPAAAAISPPSVPPRLQAGGSEEAAFALRGEGFHVYECRPGFDGRLAWVFVNPDAVLSDGTTTVATHTRPYVWEASDDRSIVSGVTRGVAAAGPSNLPWVLLAAQSDDSGGRFSGVTSVQRVNTVGGVAPTGDCVAGEESRVPFRADYYFYKRRGAA
jgi:hypothetical protein